MERAGKAKSRAWGWKGYEGVERAGRLRAGLGAGKAKSRAWGWRG